MGGRVKALFQLANFTLGPDATLNTEVHKNSVRIKAPNSSLNADLSGYTDPKYQSGHKTQYNFESNITTHMYFPQCTAIRNIAIPKLINLQTF